MCTEAFAAAAGLHRHEHRFGQIGAMEQQMGCRPTPRFWSLVIQDRNERVDRVCADEDAMDLGQSIRRAVLSGNVIEARSHLCRGDVVPDQ